MPFSKLASYSHREGRLYWLIVGIYIPFLLIGLSLEKYWIAVIPIIGLFAMIIFLHHKLLYWILLASIAFSITMDFNQRLSTDFPSEFICILLTGIFWIIYITSKPPKMIFLWNHKLFWGIIILLIWSFLTAIKAVNHTIAFKYVAAKIWYITSFFIFTYYAINSQNDIKKLFWTIYIPVFITAVYGFIRTAIGEFSFENTNKYSLPFYDNHVIYATTMTLMLPLAFAARKWYPTGSVYRSFLSFSILFLLFAIYFSYTRACYLALIGGLAFVFLLRFKKLIQVYILAVLIVTSVLFVFSKDYFYLKLSPDFNTTVMHENFKDHLISTFYGKDASSMERLNMWVGVFRMYQEKPLMGYGPNNFPSNYKPYTLTHFHTWVSDNPLNLSCHNYFWLLLAEQGLVGLFLFLLFLALVIYYIQKKYNQTTSVFNKQILSALAGSLGVFIVILFFNDLIETNKNGSLFFIFLALILCIEKFIVDDTEKPTAVL